MTLNLGATDFPISCLVLCVGCLFFVGVGMFTQHWYALYFELQIKDWWNGKAKLHLAKHPTLSRVKFHWIQSTPCQWCWQWTPDSDFLQHDRIDKTNLFLFVSMLFANNKKKNIDTNCRWAFRPLLPYRSDIRTQQPLEYRRPPWQVSANL